MPWPQPTLEALRRLQAARRTLQDMFVGRDEAVDLLMLASVAQEHLLFIGPPGTAKTELVTRYADLVEARSFHYLLTRFTEPSELFGPLDVGAFQHGTFQVSTAGMLPEAEIAFLDEVFQAGSAILNALLTLVNERVFHNGALRQRVPLMCVVGASNALPDDGALRAFADRFALRLLLEPVDEACLDPLLERGWALEAARTLRAPASPAQPSGPALLPAGALRDLHARTAEVDTQPVRHMYADVVRELRAEGVELSDRRVVKGLKLVAAAALMRESGTAEAADLWPLRHVWSRPDEAESVRGVIEPRLSEAGATRRGPVRPAQEIADDTLVLEQQAASLRGDAALGAFLSAANRLRREVLHDHPADAALRTRIETLIQATLGRMEGAHV